MRALFPAAALLTACGTSTPAPLLYALDRPGDVSFACLGTLPSDGGAGTAVPLPPLSCGFAPTTDAGPGMAESGGAQFFTAFALIAQPARGEVAVSNISLSGQYVDSDPFTPGYNGIPVGSNPVGIDTTPEGCWAITANAGSCDLGIINVLNATLGHANAISRLNVSSTAGPINARPEAITAMPSETPGSQPTPCTAPSGFVFVAYPSCHLVARVDLSTGHVLDGISFQPGQNPTLVGPDVSCTATCDVVGLEQARPQALPIDAGIDAGPVDAGIPDAAPPPVTGQIDPVSLAVESDGTKLYVGAGDSSDLVVVDLASGVPVGVRTVELEGARGIKRVSPSGITKMGQNGAGGTFNFVYIIAMDGTIHVVDVTPSHPLTECDTQIDRTFLHSFTDIHALSCFPNHDPGNPPRRVDAKGPGMVLPFGAEPLDIAFLTGAQPVTNGTDDPTAFNGKFAAISSLSTNPTDPRGVIFYANVNDNNYVDTQSGFDTTSPTIELAIPHALRDAVGQRRAPHPKSECGETIFASPNVGPARLDTDIALPVGFAFSQNGGQPGDEFAPMLHRFACDSTIALYELSNAAPGDVRGPLFPDLEKIGMTLTIAQATNVGIAEEVVITWEGPLAFRDADSKKTGAAIGLVDSHTLRVNVPGAELCAAGAEQKDFVQLLGCDSDADCSPTESCYIHPLAPSGVPGMCLFTDQVMQLSSMCRDFLTTARRYTITQVSSDTVTMVSRPRTLDETPLDGCTDANECMAIQDRELTAIEKAQHLIMPLRRYDYTCDSDAAMAGPNRCIETCKTNDDCDNASACQAGRCVYGPIPPAQCLSALQRYEVHAGEAFTVLSSDYPYRSREIIDAGTGQCVENTTLAPTWVSRFHRVEPVCTDTTVTGGRTVNPCLMTGMTEPVVPATTSTTTLGSRPTYAIRFRSLGYAFDIADVGIPLPENPTQFYSSIASGYGFSFDIAGGFLPYYQNDLSLELPTRMRYGVDNTIWIVDSGASPIAGDVKGTVLNLNLNAGATVIRLN